jgi:hypothetical protein
MRHDTGEIAKHRGVYHSNCKCRAEHVIRRGDQFPACPACKRPVTWLYTRSPIGSESSVNIPSPFEEPTD